MISLATISLLIYDMLIVTFSEVMLLKSLIANCYSLSQGFLRDVCMKVRLLFLLIIVLPLVACGSGSSAQVPIAQLPDPAIYALTITELPEVGLIWQPSYNQSSTGEGYKWAYLAYQAYQPAGSGGELESAFAVNNDIILYELDVHRQDLPQPPQTLGDIQGISWKTATQLHRLGDKSALWKTTLGELYTPVWWLEFYQGHAYVRISLLGFPDPIAPPILYGMADIVAERLPRSNDRLLSDAATLVPTWPAPLPTSDSLLTTPPISPTSSAPASGSDLAVLGYSAPLGETGAVAYLDETGRQLIDGIQGDADILADLGSGTAYEWVGWTDLTDPVTLTFSLPAETSVAAVQLGLNHREGLGVFVPDHVLVNGVRFDLAADAVANNQRGDMTLSGPFDGPTLSIVLYHRGRGWIMLDEVRFIPGE